MIGALHWLCFPVFLSMRCCCNIFGGRKPVHGICCGRNPKTYSSTETNILRWGMFGLFALAMVGAIVGWSGNGKWTQSLVDTFDGVLDPVAEFVRQANNTATLVSREPRTADTFDLDDVNKAFSEADKALTSAQDRRDIFKKQIREASNALVGIVYTIPLAFMIFGLLFSLFKRTCCKLFILLAMSICFFIFVRICP